MEVNMTLTPKESSLLKDLKGEEQLCVAKYQKYATEAKAPELQALLSGIATTEQEHLKTINDMESGKLGSVPSQIPAPDKSNCCAVSYANPQDKDADAFFPEYESLQWKKEELLKAEENGICYSRILFERVK